MGLAILIAHRPMSDTDRERLAELHEQLGEVHVDLALAKCLPNPGTWPDDLRREQRGIWDQIADLTTTS